MCPLNPSVRAQCKHRFVLKDIAVHIAIIRSCVTSITVGVHDQLHLFSSPHTPPPHIAKSLKGDCHCAGHRF
jgi:hypothetical protein